MLAHDMKISWINDLRIVLSWLYIPVELNISGPLNVTMIEHGMKQVKISMESCIDYKVETASRTKDLLTGGTARLVNC